MWHWTSTAQAKELHAQIFLIRAASDLCFKDCRVSTHHGFERQISETMCLQVPTATQVEVEPASEDDWELVELHAGYMEEQMLNQVSQHPSETGWCPPYSPAKGNFSNIASFGHSIISTFCLDCP